MNVLPDLVFEKKVDVGHILFVTTSTLIEVLATSHLGLTHAARGEFSDAATLLERNVALGGDLRYERFGAVAIQSAYSGAYLADVFSQLGRFDEAIGHAEAAVQIAETADHPLRASEAHVLCLAGDVAAKGGTEGAPRYYREALALAGEPGMRPLVAHCHLGLGKLHAHTDTREQAQEHLRTATAM